MSDRVLSRLRRFQSADLAAAVDRDERLRAAGWGSRYVWPVPGSDGLSLKLRIPSGSVLLDVGALAAAAPEAPLWVRQAAVHLRELAPETGIVACSACVGRDDPSDVLFTLALVHASRVDAPEMQVPDVDPDDDKVSQTVKHINDRVTLVDTLSMQSLAPGAPEAPMLVVQYLVQTSYGGLAVTFQTTHSGMFAEEAALLFHDIVATIWIGEGTPPD